MKSHKPSKPRKTVENLLLLVVGLLADMPLYYQLPRWADGLSPTFVRPAQIAASSFPIVLYMSRIHPAIWIGLMILCFIRLCHNYRWSLTR